MSENLLDPRIITGEITCDSPFFVVSYIADVCAKFEYNESYFTLDSYYESIIEKINSFEYKVVSSNFENLSHSNIKRVIRFISPFSRSEEWSIEMIKLGFDHLMSFINYDNTKKNLYGIFGRKTNNNPLLLNELCIYTMAKYHNYPMTRTTEKSEIIFFLSNIYENKIDSLRISLINKILNTNDSIISHIFYTASKIESIEINTKKPTIPSLEYRATTYDKTTIEMTYNNLQNLDKLLERVKPKDHYDAIVIAARVYSLNILESENPLKEVEVLATKRKYIPYSNFFAQHFYINRLWYDVNINWCEDLSPFIYTTDQLVNFCLNEGYEITSKMSSKECHSYMKYTRCINNFYFSPIPFLTHITNTLIYQEPIEDLQIEELIYFGSFKEQSKFVVLTIAELTAYFENSKLFLDPITNNPLENIVINKLKNFVYVDMISNKNFDELRDVILSIERSKKLFTTKFLELKKYVMNGNLEIVNDIRDYFLAGIEMGLYMRGWKINDSEKIPLASEETVYESGTNNENIQRVFSNTIEARNKLEKIKMQLPYEVVIFIESLHAIKFSKKEKITPVFGYDIRGAHIFVEKTLSECVNNIFGNIEDENSCIRTNSNWILYSFTLYSIFLGFEVPVKIDKIEIIS